MAKEKGMSETEIAALCSNQFEQAEMINEIVDERRKALDYYNQRPFGNEEEGLSSFVASDVRDTIEWMLPQLVDIFVGGDTPVVFKAENEDDAEAAETESRYCQYVFTQQNKGVIVSYGWFKDALLQKNGIVKAYWNARERQEREEYENKSVTDYEALATDPEFTIDEVTIVMAEVEYSLEDFEDVKLPFAANPQALAEIEAAAQYHVVGHRKRTIGQVKINNVAPEDFWVERDMPSIFLADANYCCEGLRKTRSDLIEEGFDADLVESLPASVDFADKTNEKADRRYKEGGDLPNGTAYGGDRSRDVIQLYSHYIRADYDGDGIAELRHVMTCGANCDYVLVNEEVDRIPYHAITPYLDVHKFYGRSVADNLMDFVRAKSAVFRNLFDNFNYSAVPRKIISGNVNVGDLMSFIPGGMIRKDASATIENDVIPFVAEAGFPLLDRLDMIRGERTGYSRETAGLNPAALSQATNLVGMTLMAQGQLLVKMIATLFAHSGYESLMLHIRELVLKYEKKPHLVDLVGKYTQIDPRSWRQERSTTINVGIGYAGKTEEIGTLQELIAMQDKAVAAQGGSLEGPLTNPSGIYNTIKRLCQCMGIKDVGNYFQDPATYQAPPPQPSLAEINLKANIQKMDNDTKQGDAKNALDLKKLNSDNEFKLAELAQKERLETLKIESQERLAEMELLYKYGKDASDRHAAAQTAAHKTISEKKAENKEKDDEDDGHETES